MNLTSVHDVVASTAAEVGQHGPGGPGGPRGPGGPGGHGGPPPGAPPGPPPSGATSGGSSGVSSGTLTDAQSDTLDTVADLLDLSSDEVAETLQSGTSLTDLLTRHGVGLDELTSALQQSLGATTTGFQVDTLL